jgi:hypothetical protein
MRLLLFVFACNQTVPAPADLLPSLVDVAGVVWDQPCHPAANVQVEASGVMATTSSSGEFALSGIASDAFLELHGDLPMLTTRGKRGDRLLLPLVPADTLTLAYTLAGIVQDDSAGTVAIAIGGSDLLPIAGATMTLTGGGDARYPRVKGPGKFDLDGAATDDGMGTAVFFNVPPGDYTLRISSSPALDDVPLTVRAGALTADILLAGAASGASIALSGRAIADPLFPGWPSPTPSPLPGARIDLTLQPAVTQPSAQPTVISAQTGADGSWHAEVPFGFRSFDLTASAPGYVILRTALECLLPKGGWYYDSRDFYLTDPHWRYANVTTGYHGHPPDPQKGVIIALLGIDQSGYPSTATLALDPPAVAADYGTANLPWPDGCQLAMSCATPADCPMGSRCEGGECLQGDAPFCSRCAADYSCPAGYNGFSTADGCFCAQLVGDCETATCPSDSDCAIQDSSSEPRTFLQVCVPWRHPLATALGARANFVDVPPGVYTVGAAGDGYTFYPAQVRVDPGVFIEAAVGWTKP